VSVDESIARIIVEVEEAASHTAIDPPVAPPKLAIDPLAFHGAVGEWALGASKYTEADPVALLASAQVMLAVLIGGGPHIVAGNDRHSVKHFSVLVGATSHGGKGTSYAGARSLVEKVDPALAELTMGGFGSGEIIVDTLADPVEPDDEIPDSRLMIYEPEMARVLRVAGREGSTLSQIIRDAFDGRTLEARSRKKTSTASGTHVGVLAHITLEELRLRLGDAEAFGGYVNRHIWHFVERGPLQPKGGSIPDELSARYAARLRPAVEQARRVAQYVRSTSAERLWEQVYIEHANDQPPGRLGASIARGHAIMLRLSLLYAVLDGSRVIEEEHIAAARARWRHGRASAEVIFGEAGLTDPAMTKLYRGIRAAGPPGLDITAQHQLFNGHLAKGRLEELRTRLEVADLIVTRTVPTGGRPAMRSIAKEAIKEKEAAHLLISSTGDAHKAKEALRISAGRDLPSRSSRSSQAEGERVPLPNAPPVVSHSSPSGWQTPSDEWTDVGRRVAMLPDDSPARRQLDGAGYLTRNDLTREEYAEVLLILDGAEADRE